MSVVFWEEPWQSMVFCTAMTYAIFRGWLVYIFAVPLVFLALFMVLTRYLSCDRPAGALKVIAPPPKNAMDQLLAVQNAISQAEESIQYGNIILRKLHALLLSIFPQASEKCALVLLLIAVVMAFVPLKYMILLCFLEAFRRYSPLRRAKYRETGKKVVERVWFSIPAAAVIDDKKRK